MLRGRLVSDSDSSDVEEKKIKTDELTTSKEQRLDRYGRRFFSNRNDLFLIIFKWLYGIRNEF